MDSSSFYRIPRQAFFDEAVRRNALSQSAQIPGESAAAILATQGATPNALTLFSEDGVQHQDWTMDMDETHTLVQIIDEMIAAGLAQPVPSPLTGAPPASSAVAPRAGGGSWFGPAAIGVGGFLAGLGAVWLYKKYAR